MDEPLNPFSEEKIAEPSSRQRHSICNSHCKLRHPLILWPLTVIGFLIKGVLMGEMSFGPARLQASNLVFRCFLCACFKPLYVWIGGFGGGWGGVVVNFLILFPIFFPLFYSLFQWGLLIFSLFSAFPPPSPFLFTLALSHRGNLIMWWPSCLPWF